MTEEQLQELQMAAGRLSRNGDFHMVVDYMEQKIINSMKNVPMAGVDTSHFLVLSLQVTENVRKVVTQLTADDDENMAKFNETMKNMAR